MLRQTLFLFRKAHQTLSSLERRVRKGGAPYTKEVSIESPVEGIGIRGDGVNVINPHHTTCWRGPNNKRANKNKYIKIPFHLLLFLQVLISFGKSMETNQWWNHRLSLLRVMWWRATRGTSSFVCIENKELCCGYHPLLCWIVPTGGGVRAVVQRMVSDHNCLIYHSTHSSSSNLTLKWFFLRL